VLSAISEPMITVIIVTAPAPREWVIVAAYVELFPSIFDADKLTNLRPGLDFPELGDQFPNCVIPVNCPLTSKDCKKVATTGVIPPRKVTGTETITFSSIVVAMLWATSTVHWSLLNVPASGPMGTPASGPNQSSPALFMRRIPLLIRLCSMRH